MILHAAEKIAYKLPPLVVEAIRTAESMTFGAHGRRRVGPGDSFYQYRQYTAGESTHRIDWRASARSERTFIRENEWEAAQTLFFWSDSSPSMQWHSQATPYSKEERAKLICLSLAALLLKGHEQIADMDGHMSPSRDPGALFRLHDSLSQAPTGNVPPLMDLPRRSHIIAIGDFLMDAEQMASWIEQVSAQGVHLILVEIADPHEESFPYKGPQEFEGLEAEDPLKMGNANAVREAYLSKRQRLRQALQASANQAGARYYTHLTNDSVKSLLFKLFTHLKAGAR